MGRYILEMNKGSIKSIQSVGMGTSLSGSSKDNTINAVNTDRAFPVSQGGSEDMTAIRLTGSTTLQEIWRDNIQHYWRRIASVIEIYGGRGYE